jgi:hypothetical protein
VDLYGSLLYLQNPYSFTFDIFTGALPNTLYTSNVVTITGFLSSIEVYVSTGEYSINGGLWSGAGQTGTIQSGDSLQLRILSSWEPSLTNEIIVTVGNYSTTFGVTTMDSELAE